MDQRERKADGNPKLPSKSVDEISYLALDIGGSLVKMVYQSNNSNDPLDFEEERYPCDNLQLAGISDDHPFSERSLRFVIFETGKIHECIDFIRLKKIYTDGCYYHLSPNSTYKIKATGGGAYKFADLFKEQLGIVLSKEDEMDCLVAGSNFLLKADCNEVFTYIDNRQEFVHIDQDDLFPYLLVNIGSGVSMIKVDGEKKFERVSGTSIGGGTYWGLGKLLTKCKSFDDLLELSHRGNNRVIDMLVGDIYGGTDYSRIGLASTNIASSFGKAVSESKEIEDYNPEDVARSLLRMISNNIGQIAYLNALRFNIKKIFFGGFFIRGHSYTMDTISVAVSFWSTGDAKAMFFRHEGFLGALGAFKSYEDQACGNVVGDGTL